MLRQLRIGTRLAVGFGGLIVASAGAFAAAVALGMHGQSETAAAALASQERIAAVSAMSELQMLAVTTLRSAGLRADSADANRDIETYRKALKSITDAEDAFARRDLDAQEQALLARAKLLRTQAEAVAGEAVKFAAAFASEEVAKVLSERYGPVQEQWGAELTKLTRLQEQRALAAADRIAASNRTATAWLGALLAAATLAGVAFAAALTRSVTVPLKAAADAAKKIAGGDLGTHIEPFGNDEVASLQASLQAMTLQLAAMVQEVRQSADSITLVSSEISGGNQDLSIRTVRQADSLQETSASIEFLSSAVQGNTLSTDSARTLVQRTADVAAHGGIAMNDVLRTMAQISDSSKRISDIIGVIDGIAFQTNILALNAAVEAARAGEQGRGFAVVASEVRALSQRVSAASREVRQLIDESAARVDSGSRTVSSMGQTMQDLIQGVDQVRGLVAEISSATQLQGQGLLKVKGSMQVIDAGTQQNAAMVEQMAASSMCLSEQTQRLSGLLTRFRLSGEPDRAY